jgi:hypothetical protein
MQCHPGAAAYALLFVAMARLFTIANPLDEETNRVMKVRFDVAIPLDPGTNAGVNDAGSAVDRAAPLQEGPPQLART